MFVQLYQMVRCELDSLKMKERELVEELSTYKDKVDILFPSFFAQW